MAVKIASNSTGISSAGLQQHTPIF